MADPNAGDGPYVGPRPFEAEERERFFGRDEEARAVASLIVAHRVVVLYAASGAGKTSLLNAGVIPLLETDDGFDVLPPVRLRGLTDPDADGNPYIENVLSNLARALGGAGTDGERARPTSLTDFLASCPRSQTEDEALPAPRALIFDQFEELFTLYPERWQQRREVFEQIADALVQDPLLRVVLAIREDFIAQLDPYALLLPTRLRTRIRLESLRRQPALEAVTGPLTCDRRTFAPGAAEQLVDDLLKVRVHTTRDESAEVPGELVEPVQLQVVCRTLWSSLPEDVEEIGTEDLARIGSVSDVLANYYREAVHAAALAGAISERELRDRLEAAFITPPPRTGGMACGGTLVRAHARQPDRADRVVQRDAATCPSGAARAAAQAGGRRPPRGRRAARRPAVGDGPG
jgi:Novel STAND NTPase 1